MSKVIVFFSIMSLVGSIVLTAILAYTYSPLMILLTIGNFLSLSFLDLKKMDREFKNLIKILKK